MINLARKSGFFTALVGLFMFQLAMAASDSEQSGHAHGHDAAMEKQADHMQDGHMEAAAEAEAVDGGKIYHDFCSVCHGDRGDGHSRARSGLNPPPKDFTQPQVAIELTRERMIKSVTEGRQGTAMSAWAPRLNAEEIEAVVDYVRASFMPAVTTETAQDGRRIFAEYCSVCHGDRGQAAVWARSGLKPPPANFTDPSVQQMLSRDRMIFSVTYGRPQTAMASWKGRLSDEEIASVVDYVRGSIMGLGPEEPEAVALHAEGGHDHDAHGVDNLDDPLPYGLEGNSEFGGDLYQRNCVACHGTKGDGHGPRAYFIFPKPRDFSHPAARAKYSRAHLFEVISHGEIGSEMPAWNKVLTDQEIGHISEYVFTSFIRPQ